MDDDAYSTSFEAFKSHMFRSPAAEPAPRNNYQQKAAERTAVPEPEDVDDGPVDTRVKELYRTLVRRLHPDLRADGVASVSALWHEVQEAYAASDVARMEILLALSQIESDHMSEETTLSQMRSLFADLVRSLRALEKSLQEAEGEDAWNFARSGAGDDLRLRVQRQLKSDLASRTARLEMLQRTITAWAEGPVANRKAALRRPPQFASRRGFTPAE
jgi:DnaJ-class molecular chaperone